MMSWHTDACWFHTFAFEEVERAKEAPISTCWGLRAFFTEELRKLSPGEIDEASSVAKHQLQEDVGVLVAELFHKEIRVEDDWRSASTTAPWGILTIGHHSAHFTTERMQKNAVISHCMKWLGKYYKWLHCFL